MTDIAIFWDASQLWGLLVWRAAEAFGLPYRLVKAKEIAQGALSDKTSLLLVPGGTARHKSAALGEKGREAVRAWVRGGGCYVGFCGGAGLGLSDAADPVRTAEIGTGLCLCPWHRAEIGERVQHFVSGHVRVRFQSGHPLVPEFFSEPVAPGSEPAIPIWWPGRFAASSGGPDDGVDVLARYAGSDPRTCPPDLCVADLPLSSLSPAVLEQWIELYAGAGVPQRTALRPARAIRQGELYAQLQPSGDARIAGREPLVRTHPAHADGIRAEGGYRPGVASR